LGLDCLVKKILDGGKDYPGSAEPAGIVLSSPAFWQIYSAYVPPSMQVIARLRTRSRSSSLIAAVRFSRDRWDPSPQGYRQPGDNFPVFETVVAQRLDDGIILISKDDISFIKKFENETVDKVPFPDIKNHDALKTVLVDGKHFSPERYLRRSMANCGGFFGGSGRSFTR